MRSIDNRNKESKDVRGQECSGKVVKLLSDKTKWIQYNAAKDKNGQVIFSEDEAAAKWCLLGAIWKCYGSTDNNIEDKVRRHIGCPISEFNDSSQYKDVMKVAKELNL